MAQEAKRDDDETPSGDPPEEKADVRTDAAPAKASASAEPPPEADETGGDDGGTDDGDDGGSDDGDDGGTGDDDGTSDDDGSDDGDDAEHGGQSAMIGTVGTRTLGIERYVQFAFLGSALILFWVLQKTIVGVWNLVSTSYATMSPDTVIATVSAAVLGGAIAWGLYKNPRVYKLVNDVTVELSKVTWPSRQETYTSTIVVLVTSVVAAVYLGVWDFIWSGLTDLIYKV